MEEKHPLLRRPFGNNQPREVQQPSSSAGLSSTEPPDNWDTRPPDGKDCRACLAAMTHRLAQPITALRGGIELALMGNHSAADYHSLLEQSLQLADQMAQLVISLRDLGESAAPAGTPQSLFLGAVTAEVLAELRGVAESRGLRLQLSAEGTVEICADPERLREALQSLLGWVIQNSGGQGVIAVEVSASENEARVFVSPPRLDLQYLQIKVLEDLTEPGLLFSHAVKNGALGWAINQRLLNGLGGKLEILTEGLGAGRIRARFRLAPQSEKDDLS
jgi:two-component system, OmpR family, sensor histidine kinase BaeS